MIKKVQLSKPFLTYAQQVDKLKHEKKLIINDDAYAIQLLKEHSYFALISGYKKPFKVSDGTYKLHTTIEDIYRLYEFDDSLRSLFLHFILKVEKYMKSMISYTFCERYGAEQCHYLDGKNYNSQLYTKAVQDLMAKLSFITEYPQNYPYITHQKNKNGNIPLWVMLKALTLGSVSKMYGLLQPQLQTTIAKEFTHLKVGNLKGMLEALSQIRNVCAHNERLFDYKNKKAIDDTNIHKDLLIPKVNNTYKQGKTDVFATLIALKYLLSKKDFFTLVDTLDTLIKTLCAKTYNLHESQLYKYMGLPSNWLNIKLCG